ANVYGILYLFFFFSSRRRHTSFSRDWSSDVCSSDLVWTFRKGDLGIHSASEIIATDRDPSIGYYIEVYPRAERPLNGKLVGAVKIGRASCRERVNEEVDERST